MGLFPSDLDVKHVMQTRQFPKGPIKLAHTAKRAGFYGMGGGAFGARSAAPQMAVAWPSELLRKAGRRARPKAALSQNFASLHHYKNQTTVQQNLAVNGALPGRQSKCEAHDAQREQSNQRHLAVYQTTIF